MSIRWMDGRKPKKDGHGHRLILKLGYSVYDKVRIRLAQDNNWLCEYCRYPVTRSFDSGRDLATIDHKIPLSRGGSWKRFNLTCACRWCNDHKGDMTDDEYRLYLHLTREP